MHKIDAVAHGIEDLIVLDELCKTRRQPLADSVAEFGG